LKPLAEKRRDDGFEAVVSTKSIPESLAAAGRRPDFLLLVGDDQAGQEAAPWYLPAKRMKLYRWRSAQAKEFASDAAWGGLDRDGLPTFPVGRIPARSREEIETVVRKILAFEKQPPTAADLQMPAWLGSPEYTATINAMSSGLGVRFFQARGPAWLRPWFVSGTAGDAFCGWPLDQSARFTRQMKQGGIVGLMLGHANADGFYSMSYGGKPVFYTAADSANEFAKGPPAAPMIFFSCESGKFDRPAPCQAKALLMMPGGPVATIGATTESHPLPNYFSSAALLAALGGKDNRLGPLWLHAQREGRHAHDFVMEMMTRDVEGSLETPINVEKLRRDQVLMYELLGDPATRLRLPEKLEASADKIGGKWRWRAVKPPRATKLEVGFRPAEPFAGVHAVKMTDARTANAGADKANLQLSFIAQSTLSGEQAWKGDFNQPGWLRLVATGPGVFKVAVLRLQ
jgi:hypothetical protein